MPEAQASGLDSAEFQRYDFTVKHRQQPAHRAHKSLRLAGAPVHVLGPVERLNLFRQSLGQHLRRAPALFRHCGRKIFPFRIAHLVQLGNLHSGFPGKSFSRSCRLAVFEGDLQRWTKDLFGHIGL